MIDLTNLRSWGNPQPVQQAQPRQEVKAEPVIIEEEPEVKKGLWTIDKFDHDGQIEAGQVDRQQEEFLKNTEWVR